MTENAEKCLKSHPDIRKKFYITPLQGQMSIYKIIFLSLHPFSGVHRLDIPYKDSPRKAIIVHFDYENPKHNLLLAAVHLESAGHHTKVRRKQLEFIYSKLPSLGFGDYNKIVLGDFNFLENEEDETFLKGGYTDMWVDVQKTRQGATWGMARLDRVTTVLSGWKHSSIEIIGKDRVLVTPVETGMATTAPAAPKEASPKGKKPEPPPLPNPKTKLKYVHISDHYGLLAKITKK
eukprot:TRINITY_DN14275_c0_g1_i4.p1 TRINITY_DN14275_c0_g1~~TRINITY_DN14275_c0_g1_i4.p1  ORF type:complete len:234 (-),score=63.80 TRINITY_DN14275_c0_g1_i4:3-704(-)